MSNYDGEHTPRGFPVFGTIVDTRGVIITVQESSAVGPPRAYIFTEDADGVYMGGSLAENPPPHINVEQAKELHAAIGRFIANSEDPKHWRNSDAYREAWD